MKQKTTTLSPINESNVTNGDEQIEQIKVEEISKETKHQEEM